MGFNAYDNNVHLIVKLCDEIAIKTFLKFLQQCTSYWITGQNPDKISFWEDNFWLNALSPEDKDVAINQFEHKWNDGLFNLPRYSNLEDSMTNRTNCHHIIFATARCRKILSMKFRLQLYDGIRGICSEMNSIMIDTVSMRNHIHLLCYVPFSDSVTSFYGKLKSRLTEWMHSNIHYRRVDELSSQFIAFTVSQEGLYNEECILMYQERIHSGKFFPSQPKCEEHVLYDRLGYFTSLILK